MPSILLLHSITAWHAMETHQPSYHCLACDGDPPALLSLPGMRWRPTSPPITALVTAAVYVPGMPHHLLIGEWDQRLPCSACVRARARVCVCVCVCVCVRYSSLPLPSLLAPPPTCCYVLPPAPPQVGGTTSKPSSRAAPRYPSFPALSVTTL